MNAQIQAILAHTDLNGAEKAAFLPISDEARAAIFKCWGAPNVKTPQEWRSWARVEIGRSVSHAKAMEHYARRNGAPAYCRFADDRIRRVAIVQGRVVTRISGRGY